MSGQVVTALSYVSKYVYTYVRTYVGNIFVIHDIIRYMYDTGLIIRPMNIYYYSFSTYIEAYYTYIGYITSTYTHALYVPNPIPNDLNGLGQSDPPRILQV